MKNKLLVTVFVLLTAFSSFSMPSYAVEQQSIMPQGEPGFFAMVGDLLIARPFTLAASIIGTGIYVVSLPLSYAGGNHIQAANTLVRKPLYNTFMRCLGCTQSQALLEIENHEKIYHDLEH